MATRENLRLICELGKQLIGDNHASFESLLTRFQKCDEIAWCIWKDIENKAPKLVGYLIFYPLNTAVTNRIRERRLVNALHLSEKDITKSFSSANAIYVSMVAGLDHNSKAVAILALEDQLSKLTRCYKRINYVFAKPATPDGRRLLEKHGFVSLGSGTEIWAISVSRLEKSYMNRPYS